MRTPEFVRRTNSSRLLARRAVVPSRLYPGSTNSALGVCLPANALHLCFVQGAVENLDTFFSNMYKYYHSRGVLSIVSTGVAHLLILAFTVGRSNSRIHRVPMSVFACIYVDVGGIITSHRSVLFFRSGRATCRHTTLLALPCLYMFSGTLRAWCKQCRPGW